MSGLKQIKGKIRATDRTRKVTKAMEAVSAAKMRKTQERAIAGRAYAFAALSILERVSAALDASHHPFVRARAHGTGVDAGRTLLLVVTSDKGLAGGLNGNVLRAAGVLAREHGGTERVGIIAVGRKAIEHFRARGYRIEASYENISDQVSVSDLRGLAQQATGRFAKAEYTSVYVVYQNFVSTFAQEAVARRILPLAPADLEEIIKGITPVRGRFTQTERLPARVPAYSIEPSPEAVLERLLPDLVEIMLYHAMLEAKASEHSARMVAMKNASDKARDVSKALNLAYNKARQAVITREVSEITGGIEAMNSQ